ncbi:TPA: hypothetical protein RK087_002999 [Enterobacter hormaechei subsp. xiangfangensis]|nr:hypothetical protein [Enterobacter hormaechei subsp. xiangfangensis]
MSTQFLVFDKTYKVRVAEIEDYEGDEFVFIPSVTEVSDVTSTPILNKYVVIRYGCDGSTYLLAIRDNVVPLNPEVHIQTTGIKPYL